MTGARLDDVADTVVRLHQAKQAAKPKTNRRLRFRFAGSVQPQLAGQYVIKGHLWCGLAVYFGRANAGKTAVVFDLAAHVAGRMPYRGRRTRGGLVVWLALEAPQSLDNRLVAWCRHHGFDAGGLSLAVVAGTLDLRNKASVSEAIDLLSEIEAQAAEPIALLVIDTLARAMPGADENSFADMGAAIAALDRIRTEARVDALVALHHVGKDDSRGPRGHSSLIAAVDGAYEVRDGEVICTKARDGKVGESLPVLLQPVEVGVDEDGDPVTAVVAVAADAPVNAHAAAKPRRSLTDGSKLALRVLRELLRAEGIAGDRVGAPASAVAVTIDRWRDEHRERYGGASTDKANADAERKAWQRAIGQLQAANIVIVAGQWVWTNDSRA